MPDQSADTFDSIRFLNTSDGKQHRYFSLAALAESGFDNIGRLPIVIRILLESVLRNCDGTKVLESHVTDLASWKPNAQRENEIPFVEIGRAHV